MNDKTNLTENVTLEMVKHYKSTILGGKIKDIPKPYILRYPNNFEKRPLRIGITIWKAGSAIGAGGHYHVDIREENNQFWDVSKNSWITPWTEDWDSKYYNDYRLIKGRVNLFVSSTDPMAVCEWINNQIDEWSITDKSHEIKWEFYGTEDEEEEKQFIDNVKLK